MALIPQAELAQSSSPFADAAVALFGNWGGALVAVGAIVGSGLEVAAYGLILLAAGFPIYRLQKSREA